MYGGQNLKLLRTGNEKKKTPSGGEGGQEEEEEKLGAVADIRGAVVLVFFKV